MYRLLRGKVSDYIDAQAAGRALLERAIFPAVLPEIIRNHNGKPGFAREYPLWFNISHSGDDIVLLLSDEGEVGCDIEVIRPRKNSQRIVESIFSPGEQAQIAAAEDKLVAFWQIWTRKEAMLKQAGSQIWRIADFDSCLPTPLFLAQLRWSKNRIVTLCTPTPVSAQENDFIVK